LKNTKTQGHEVISYPSHGNATQSLFSTEIESFASFPRKRRIFFLERKKQGIFLTISVRPKTSSWNALNEDRRKHFFEKRSQKPYVPVPDVTGKGFLVLFFKKERLPFCGPLFLLEFFWTGTKNTVPAPVARHPADRNQKTRSKADHNNKKRA
jgi:hypothetical protein